MIIIYVYFQSNQKCSYKSTNMGYLINAVYIFFTCMKYKYNNYKSKRKCLHVYTSIGDPSIAMFLGTFFCCSCSINFFPSSLIAFCSFTWYKKQEFSEYSCIWNILCRSIIIIQNIITKCRQERGKPTLTIASNFVFHWINISKLANQMLWKNNVHKMG